MCELHTVNAKRAKKLLLSPFIEADLLLYHSHSISGYPIRCCAGMYVCMYVCTFLQKDQNRSLFLRHGTRVRLLPAEVGRGRRMKRNGYSYVTYLPYILHPTHHSVSRKSSIFITLCSRYVLIPCHPYPSPQKHAHTHNYFRKHRPQTTYIMNERNLSHPIPHLTPPPPSPPPPVKCVRGF